MKVYHKNVQRAEINVYFIFSSFLVVRDACFVCVCLFCTLDI